MSTVAAAGKRGIHIELDHPLRSYGGIPGLLAIEGWLEAIGEFEEEMLNNGDTDYSDSPMPDTLSPSGSTKSKSKMKSEVPWTEGAI